MILISLFLVKSIFYFYFKNELQEVFMYSTITILNTELEYDFLSAWIKYTRIKNRISQEALSHGICSISHLSYFENGKKNLRKDIIEALLKRLNIKQLNDLENIGLIRQKLNTMMNDIESFNHDGASAIYDQLIKIKNVIELSPYNMEFKIYELMYKSLVLNIDYNDLKQDIIILDKIIHSLTFVSKELLSSNKRWL
jgi:transcriptional regulator with XRE-family HTH domain